ncbi:MAG: hypothetical protein LBI69_04515 [Puniceicoccales bacterium]|jgi:pullulanase/glycogen debranching enzyme|nr:hypothetical protein [Puniceicoccales bacterium]
MDGTGAENLFYDIALGAFPGDGGTVFRIFAPNANSLQIRYGNSLNLESVLDGREIFPGLWEANSEQNLHGQFYAIAIAPKETFSIPIDDFQHLLDPYAVAAISARGPGIAIDRKTLPLVDQLHQPRPMEDSIILEGHLRDLLALQDEGIKFPNYVAFCQWLKSPSCYLSSLGITALELQPLQEFDSIDDGNYHWGYMTVNYFAPTRTYATNKHKASQIEQFAEVVHTCHEKGLDFILDVVYNHVGEPNHLRMLGGNYFFRINGGNLSNASGCGNDFASESPMGQRLILDSLKYLVTTYDIDGFRFDLAELIDQKTLRAIELELRRIKPGIILIAEPWSFRGHNALALKETSWSYWNDDFRESIRRYVMGNGNCDGLKYFLCGCTSHLARVPAQSINYTESHDDRVWIDNITESQENDGRYPHPNDLQRTHLMFAILFACLGVPMIAEGQDFLRSKGGVSNTYRDGERNRLSLERWEEFFSLHHYVAQWIELRLSADGQLFRHSTVPAPSFFQFFYGAPSQSALGVLYNADESKGDKKLLFFINPDFRTVSFDLTSLPWQGAQLICDGRKFYKNQSHRHLDKIHRIDAISCQLWSINPGSFPPR